jgi:hypothetical protein
MPEAQKNSPGGDRLAVAPRRGAVSADAVACHGGDARGDRGPALATETSATGSEDSESSRPVSFLYSSSFIG